MQKSMIPNFFLLENSCLWDSVFIGWSENQYSIRILNFIRIYSNEAEVSRNTKVNRKPILRNLELALISSYGHSVWKSRWTSSSHSSQHVLLKELWTMGNKMTYCGFKLRLSLTWKTWYNPSTNYSFLWSYTVGHIVSLTSKKTRVFAFLENVQNKLKLKGNTRTKRKVFVLNEPAHVRHWSNKGQSQSW